MRYKLMLLVIKILHGYASRSVTPCNYYESYKSQNMHDSRSLTQFATSSLSIKWESI